MVFAQETGAFQGLLRHRKGTIHWDHVAIVLLAFLRRKRVNCGLFWLFFQMVPVFIAISLPLFFSPLINGSMALAGDGNDCIAR